MIIYKDLLSDGRYQLIVKNDNRWRKIAEDGIRVTMAFVPIQVDQFDQMLSQFKYSQVIKIKFRLRKIGLNCYCFDYYPINCLVDFKIFKSKREAIAWLKRTRHKPIIVNQAHFV